MITEAAVPRNAAGDIALCHGCQRRTYFRGGYIALLAWDVRRLAYRQQSQRFRALHSDEFLNAPEAVNLTAARVAAMTDAECEEALVRIRFSGTGGKPTCPRCACGEFYIISTRGLWRCKDCRKDYSVTSDTPFNAAKRDARTYLLSIALLRNTAIPVHQAARDLKMQYKAADYLAKRLRNR